MKYLNSKIFLKIVSIISIFTLTTFTIIASANTYNYATTDLKQLQAIQQFELESLQIVNPKTIIKNWTLMLEFKSKPTTLHIQNIRKLFYTASIELFDNIKSPYFERLYKLTFKGTLNFKNSVFRNLKNATELNPELNLLTIEETYLIESQSITPNQDHRSPLISNDLFTSYLWGLENREQLILKDLDDIHLEKIKGKIGVDIGIRNIYKKIDSQIQNEVLVAIVDSGVDIDHPDLKDGIAKNLIECDNGTLPFKPTEDKDKNGYIGDCMGWSFVSTKKDGDERPYDDVGHGTHLAGIMAATIDNKQGVAGVSSKIKIVPVKVLQRNENASGSAGGLATGGLSDRIAKGILYAIKRNVQVINLSIGWPISVDTKYLKMSIIEAQNKGIIIVAAAGNNNHSSPIFPCAYPNVICVGAMDAAGNFANFSNYGGHVDLLAPGDNILSTYPQKLTPDFFAVKGYEIKNGTSQAAPYVSAAVALLKGLNPQISFNEISARLFAGSTPNSATLVEGDKAFKYSLYGSLNIEKSIKITKTPIVVPVLKKLEEVIIQSSTKNFNFIVPIKNLWADTKNIKVTVDLDRTFNSTSSAYSTEITFKKKTFTIEQLNEGETKELSIEGEIRNIEQDNTLAIIIKISSDTFAEKTFYHQLRIVTSLEKDPRFLEIVKEIIIDPSIKKPIAMRREDEMRTNLSTITDPFFQNKYPEYYIEDIFDKGTKIFIFRTDSSDKVSPFKVALTLTIPNSSSLLSVSLQDVNYDGKLEYQIITIAKIAEEKFIQYSYFNYNGDATFKTYNHLRFVPETSIVNYKKVTYIPYKSSLLKSMIAIPFYFDEGKTPAKDLNKDPFEENSNASTLKDYHFFYLTPTKEKDKNIYFETRIFDNYQWNNIARSKLAAAWNDSIDMVDILPQSLQNFKNGLGYGIISVGKNYLRNYYSITFKPQYTEELNEFDINIEPLTTNGVHLEGSFLFPITNLDLSSNSSNQINSGAMFVGHETNTNVRMSLIDYSKRDRNLLSILYSHPFQRDSVLSAFACYKSDNDYYTFLQTKSSLLLERFTDRGVSYVDMRPITRFSFLPGSLYNEIFYPISISNPKRPALYVDATEINRKDIYILTLDTLKKLISPIKYNIRVPTNCKSLNPNPIAENSMNLSNLIEEKKWAYSLLCEDQKKWYLHYLILD